MVLLSYVTPFVINIMCLVHDLGTKEEGENLQVVPRSTPIDTIQDYPVINNKVSLVNGGFKQTFSAVANRLLYNMA